MNKDVFEPIVLPSQQAPKEPQNVQQVAYPMSPEANAKFKKLADSVPTPTPQDAPASPTGDTGVLEGTVNVLADVGKGLVDTYNGLPSYVVEGAANAGNAVGLINDKDMSKFRDLMSTSRDIGRGDKSVTESILGEAIQLSPVGTGAFKAFQMGGMAAKWAAITAASVSEAMSTNPDNEILMNLLPEDGDSSFVRGIRDVVATDPEDPSWMNRARKATEVLGLGVGVEKLIGGLRTASKSFFKSGENTTPAYDPLANTQAVDGAPEVAAENVPPVAQTVADPLIDGTPSDVAAKFQQNLSDVAKEGKVSKNDAASIPINMDKIATSEDVKQVMESTARSVNEHVIADWTDVQTFEEINRIVVDLLDDPADVLQSLDALAGASKEQLGTLMAAKHIQVSQATAVRDASRLLKSDASEVVEQDFYNKLIIHAKTLDDIKQVVRGGARMTSAGRIEINGLPTGDPFSFAGVSDIAKPTSEELRKLADQFDALDPDNLQGWRKLFNGISTSKKWEVVNELYINSILSGPVTHTINFVSNSVETFMLPFENLVGGALTGNGAAMRSGANQYAGIVLGIKDSFRAAAAAARKEEAILDPTATTIEVNYKATDKVFGSSLGQFLRLPTRALSTSDELFKQVNYRGKLFAMGMEEAPVDLSLKERVAFAKAKVESGFNAKGGATNETALQYSREATFTEELGAGTWGKSLQDLAVKHPSLKTFMPFVRTPSNLIKHQYHRTPIIGLNSKVMRADWAAGGERRAKMVGKQAVGSTFTLAGLTLAFNGSITGAGPADNGARSKLMATGWRPYSFRVTNEDGSVEFISYKRSDPRFMLFGMLADTADIVGNLEEGEQIDLSQAILFSFSQTLSNKAYFNGIASGTDALIGGDPYKFKKWVGQTLTSHTIPFSAALRQTNQDPALREVRTLLDHYKNAIPSLSETLDPKRNILGEAIMNPAGMGVTKLNPFHGVKWKNDKVAEEIAKVGSTIHNPPTRDMSKGIDLLELKNSKGQSAYDRWLELVTLTTIGSKGSLQEALEHVVQSDRYLAQPDDPFQDYEGSRRSQINAQIGYYRKRAYKTLQKEFPEIRDTETNFRKDLNAKRHDARALLTR